MPAALIFRKVATGGTLLWLGLWMMAGVAGPVRAENTRIVSLNPSLTSILVVLGAADRLVGVDDYSAQEIEEVSALPRVGGLFNPSLEAVVGLKPDLVVLVPSAEQRDFQARLAALGIRVETFENVRFDQVLENIERLGVLADRRDAAARRIHDISRVRETARVLTGGRDPQKVLMVLQRDPLYVVGHGNFMAEMVTGLGARNGAASFSEPYPRVAREWLVESAPDILIDLSPDTGDPAAFWSRWPSIPAVAQGRIVRLDPGLIGMPGPYLDRATLQLAASLYGPEFAARIEAESRP
ncbi:MAG: helical backbone metal receptor [Myxococcota bacterium]